MTEPNDPAPPLSRMRFSWQRGTPPREGDTASPDPAYGQDQLAPVDESAAYQPPAADQGYGAMPAPAARSVQQPPQQARDQEQPPAASRLGRAIDPYPNQTAGDQDSQRPVSREIARHASADSIVAERFDLDDDGRRWSQRARQAARSRGGDPAIEPTGDGRTTTAQSGPRVRTDGYGAGSSGGDTWRDRNAGGDSGRNRARNRDRNGGGSRGASARTSGAARTRFEVPKPGGRFSGGRGSHVGIRLVLLVTACLLVLGITGYTAYTYGIASVRNDDYALSQQDIDRFGLTEFPEEQAGRFAADYARLCMTHSDEEGGEERRQQQLAEYVSSGVDASCGWSGVANQQVVDATWTGESEPINVDGYGEQARIMTVRVLTSDERSQMLTVPVYVADLRTGEGMRVIGDLGEMPQTLLVAPPEAEPVGQVDQQLTEALSNDQFFQQFFEAWGASDEPSINRFVTPNATDRARTGLSDTLQQPTIADVDVFLPADADTEHRWRQGDRTEAYVWVSWQNAALGEDVTVTRAYRLQLVMTEQAANVAQGWAVHDVRGGVPSVETN